MPTRRVKDTTLSNLILIPHVSALSFLAIILKMGVFYIKSF